MAQITFDILNSDVAIKKIKQLQEAVALLRRWDACEHEQGNLAEVLLAVDTFKFLTNFDTEDLAPVVNTPEPK
jgi:hypothetical protein